MRKKNIIIGLVSLLSVVIIAILALILIPKFLTPTQVPTQSYWPTNGWRTSTPEEQGLDSGKLAEVLQEIKNKTSRSTACWSSEMVRSFLTPISITPMMVLFPMIWLR